MKLEELKKDFKIYLDMDGVFADFDRYVYELTKKHPWDFAKKDYLWKWIIADINKGNEPFAHFREIKGSHKLFDYVKPYNPKFLTSTGHTKPVEIGNQKKKWIDKRYPGTPVITTTASKLKAQYAAPNAVLIDDRAKSIDPWVEAGGIGILFKNPEQAIQELKDLGI